ncbi:MAG: hypothetical protein M0Q94_10540 [Candidatus Cloacimonetes bacterium]|jgi:hypothetical protein|nr:hypothetical protein [Candidatus Cloacimonadota bacterium]
MRPIEKKVLDKIKDKGLSLDDVWEIVDNTPTSELKKSYPDDCHFQSTKYFAKTIWDSLLRSGKVVKDNNKIIIPKKDENKGDKN